MPDAPTTVVPPPDSWRDWPPVRDHVEANAFIQAMGACFLFRRVNVGIPALSDVCAPESEWAGHPMVWKDILHEGRGAYYGTMILGKTSLIVPELLPAFYRLQGMSADEYLDAYGLGIIDPVAVRVLRALLDEGPMTTRQLRRAANIAGTGEKPAFSAATHALMRSLTISVVASQSRQLAGYQYLWDVFERRWPEVGASAVVRYPDPADAIIVVADRCDAWLGDADAATLFGWTHAQSNAK